MYVYSSYSFECCQQYTYTMYIHCTLYVWRFYTMYWYIFFSQPQEPNPDDPLNKGICMQELWNCSHIPMYIHVLMVQYVCLPLLLRSWIISQHHSLAHCIPKLFLLTTLWHYMLCHPNKSHSSTVPWFIKVIANCFTQIFHVYICADAAEVLRQNRRLFEQNVAKSMRGGYVGSVYFDRCLMK